LAVHAAGVVDAHDAVEHQHVRQRQPGIAGAEEFAVAAGQQLIAAVGVAPEVALAGAQAGVVHGGVVTDAGVRSLGGARGTRGGPRSAGATGIVAFGAGRLVATPLRYPTRDWSTCACTESRVGSDSGATTFLFGRQ